MSRGFISGLCPERLSLITPNSWLVQFSLTNMHTCGMTPSFGDQDCHGSNTLFVFFFHFISVLTRPGFASYCGSYCPGFTSCVGVIVLGSPPVWVLLSRVRLLCGCYCPGFASCVGVIVPGSPPVWELLSRVRLLCGCYCPGFTSCVVVIVCLSCLLVPGSPPVWVLLSACLVYLSRVRLLCGCYCPGFASCVGVIVSGSPPVWVLLSRVRLLCGCYCLPVLSTRLGFASCVGVIVPGSPPVWVLLSRVRLLCGCYCPGFASCVGVIVCLSCLLVPGSPPVLDIRVESRQFRMPGVPPVVPTPRQAAYATTKVPRFGGIVVVFYFGGKSSFTN